MQLAQLSSIGARLKNLIKGESAVRTHHQRIVQFWVYSVCISLVSVVTVILLSLSLWFVTPPSDVVEVLEIIPEEKHKAVDGEYDTAKAEKILKTFEARVVPVGKK
jgi:hypothetical protein